MGKTFKVLITSEYIGMKNGELDVKVVEFDTEEEAEQVARLFHNSFRGSVKRYAERLN